MGALFPMFNWVQNFGGLVRKLIPKAMYLVVLPVTEHGCFSEQISLKA